MPVIKYLLTWFCKISDKKRNENSEMITTIILKISLSLYNELALYRDNGLILIHSFISWIKMDKETDNIQTFNEWIDAFKRRDISDMVMLVTDDVKINSIMFKTYKGKEGARKYWQELFNASPNIKVDVSTITANTDRVIAEIDVSGNLTGKVAGSPGLGKKFNFRGAFAYECHEKKIREIRMYYDSSVLKRQLNTEGIR